MGPKERREREREEIRTSILEAARDLFANEGVEAVTMRRIAEKIEYSPTAIYFHFKDKESLLAELWSHVSALEVAVAEASRRAEPARLTHPYFGELSLTDGVRFCAIHTRHHGRFLPVTTHTRAP